MSCPIRVNFDTFYINTTAMRGQGLILEGQRLWVVGCGFWVVGGGFRVVGSKKGVRFEDWRRFQCSVFRFQEK